MVRSWLDPTNWLTELARLAALDTGEDWDITLRNGRYDVAPLTSVPLILRKHRGGVISLHADDPRGATLFSSSSVGSAPHIFFDGADEIFVDGINLEGEPEVVLNTLSPRRVSLELGGYSTQRIWWTQSTLTGDGILLRLVPSQDPSIYTDIVVRDLVARNIGTNGTLLIRNPNLFPSYRYRGAYAHIRLADMDGHAISGVDGAAWGGVSSTHGGGGALFELGVELAGNSTLEVENWIHTTQIQGSNNHDLHCFRLGGFLSANVRVTFRDCRLRGEWIDGHISGQGGGDGILWLGYTHSSGPNWVSARPRIDFEDCSFSTFISANVDEFETTVALRQYTQQASADVHFWDCRFEWTDETLFYTPTPNGSGFGNDRVMSITITTPYASVFLHNCTTFANDGTVDPAYLPTTTSTLSSDTQTRAYEEEALWRRSPTIPEILPPPPNDDPATPFSNRATDGDFSLGLWTLSEGASIVASPFGTALRLSGSWSAPANLVVDPYFETQSAAWQFLGAAEFSIERAYEGLYSGRMYSQRSVFAGNLSGTIYQGPITVSPATTYSFNFRLFSQGGPPTGNINIFWSEDGVTFNILETVNGGSELGWVAKSYDLITAGTTMWILWTTSVPAVEGQSGSFWVDRVGLGNLPNLGVAYAYHPEVDLASSLDLWTYSNSDSAAAGTLTVRTGPGGDPSALGDVILNGTDIATLTDTTTGWVLRKITSTPVATFITGFGLSVRLTFMPTFPTGAQFWDLDLFSIIPADAHTSAPRTLFISNPDFEGGSAGWTLAGGAFIDTSGWHIPSSAPPADLGTSVLALPLSGTATFRVTLPDLFPYRRLDFYGTLNRGPFGVGGGNGVVRVRFIHVSDGSILLSQNFTLPSSTAPPGNWTAFSTNLVRPFSSPLDIQITYLSGGSAGALAMIDSVVLR